MAKYAVIKLKGMQYKVSEGDEILVDFIGSEKPNPQILLVVDGEKVTVGKPEVKGAKVSLKILEDKLKGKKTVIVKYKAKSRYRRKKGFRPLYTRLLVEKIS